MYFAEPNKSDTLLYIWSLQYGAGVGLIVSYQQFSRMFPENKGIILGTFNLAAQSSTLWPQAWDVLITKGRACPNNNSMKLRVTIRFRNL